MAAGGGRVAWYRDSRRVSLGIRLEFKIFMLDHSVVWNVSEPTPIPGAAWTTSTFRDWDMAFNDQGHFLLNTVVTTANNQSLGLIANVTTQEVVLQEGDLIAGTGTVIEDVGRFRVSPNGRRIGTSVSTGINPCFNGSSISWLLVDGAPIRFGGQPVKTAANIPAGAGPATGERVESAFLGPVSDSGEATYSLGYGSPCAFPTSYAYFRDDQFLGTTGTPGLSGAAFLFSTGLIGGLQSVQLDVEGRPVAGSTSPVDVDADGAIDPGWSLASLGAPGDFTGGYRVDTFDQVYARLRIREAGSPPIDAFVHVEDPLVGSVYCPGTPNSTGRAAELVGVGSAVVARNDFSLVAHRMPISSFGYALVSRTPGLVAQPAGSQGVLCLGGDIGRFAGSIFDSGTRGSAITDVDLASLPQPQGTATAIAGEVWHFQAWYRDVIGGQATSNFTAAIEVTMR